MKSIFELKKSKSVQKKIHILTCYDYTFASILKNTSLDAILIGDSLGNVMQGRKNTLAVSMEDMIYHTKSVVRANTGKLLIADMPFLSYQVSIEKAVRNAGYLIQKGGADAVKLEGVKGFEKTIESIINASIPVMGHLGLQPQSICTTQNFGLQARSQEERDKILEEACLLENLGCFAIVLEMIPENLAQEITEKIKIPTIGIGAGCKTDGQILVLQDMLGMNPDFNPKFLRKFKNLSKEITDAVSEYCSDVENSNYPSPKETFYK